MEFYMIEISSSVFCTVLMEGVESLRFDTVDRILMASLIHTFILIMRLIVINC